MSHDPNQDHVWAAGSRSGAGFHKQPSDGERGQTPPWDLMEDETDKHNPDKDHHSGLCRLNAYTAQTGLTGRCLLSSPISG